MTNEKKQPQTIPNWSDKPKMSSLQYTLVENILQ